MNRPKLSHGEKLKRVVLIFCSLLVSFNAFTQQNPLKFSYLTVDDGLSHTDVKDVRQDKLGFIWIATLYGLDRFDGHEIKRFYNTTIPKNYAFKNRIRSMCLDENDRIWLGSEDGIQYFDPRTERYVNMENTPHRIGKKKLCAFDLSEGRVFGNPRRRPVPVI
ncbi:two-component regulator propeller domain-containing protein [Mucilaginibacter sp. UC70_90]